MNYILCYIYNLHEIHTIMTLGLWMEKLEFGEGICPNCHEQQVAEP